MSAGLLDRTVGQVGRIYLGSVDVVGGAAVLLGRIARRMMRGQFDRPQTWQNLYDVGVRSYPIVVVTALFVGAIMVIQSAHFIERTNATSLLGYGVGFSVLGEIGPVLVGLMFSGRVGANNTAELGTMVVTEQVDALRALAIDPISYLVVPRFIAMSMLTLLMVLGDLFGIIGAAVTSEVLLDYDAWLLIDRLLEAHLLDEFLMGVVKALCFSVSISCLSCHFGLTVRGGATGVGRAVNNSVVANATAIFIIDFIVGTLYTL